MVYAVASAFIGKDRSRVFRDTIVDSRFFFFLEIHEGIARSEGAAVMKCVAQERARAAQITSLNEFESWLHAALIKACVPTKYALAAGVLYRNIIYVKTVGEGEVHMRRGKNFVRLIHGTKVASGYVKPGDLLVFTSQSFRLLIEEEEALKSTLDNGSPEEIVAKLDEFYDEKPDHATVAIFAEMVEGAKVEDAPAAVPLIRPADPAARASAEGAAARGIDDGPAGASTGSVSSSPLDSGGRPKSYLPFERVEIDEEAVDTENNSLDDAGSGSPPRYTVGATMNTETEDDTRPGKFVQSGAGPTGSASAKSSAESSKGEPVSLVDTGGLRPIGDKNSAANQAGPAVSRADTAPAARFNPFVNTSGTGLRKSLRSRVVIGSALAVVAVIFVWSVVFGYQRRQAAESRRKIDEVSKLIDKKTSEAEEIAFLNMDRAMDLLKESRAAVAELKTSLDNGFKTDIALLEKKIQDKENIIVQKEEKEPAEFYDLALEDKNAKGDRMFLSGDKIAILDTTAKTIYNFDAAKKSLEKSRNDAVAKATLVGVFRGALYFYVPGDGVFVFDDDTKVRNLIKNDPDWGSIDDMAFFAGNIYLLDGKAGNVYKYVPAGAGFGPKSSYFIGTKPDLTGANSLKIDASVYVGLQKKVMKFTRGLEDQFQAAFPTADVVIHGIYTDEETEMLYVWDKKNASIYVLDKKGGYNRQIKAGILGKAADFLVYKNKILLLSGSRIYELTGASP